MEIVNEVRLETPHQSYGNIHLNIPDLHNFDGHGGRPKSELMVTSVEQSVTGKKVFEKSKYMIQLLIIKQPIKVMQIQS